MWTGEKQEFCQKPTNQNGIFCCFLDFRFGLDFVFLTGDLVRVDSVIARDGTILQNLAPETPANVKHSSANPSTSVRHKCTLDLNLLF